MVDIVMLVHQGEGCYGASFPDFPGATTAAQDLDALHRKAVDMLAFHVAGITEDGEEAPRPRSFEELQDDPAFCADSEGALVVLIDLPGLDAAQDASGKSGVLGKGPAQVPRP